MTSDFDVLVIGAGTAGLTAMRDLTRAGLKTLCLEARDRIGGRIFTLHDPLTPVPIELGPEFVHGRPPEIWDLVRSGHLTAYDCFEKAVHIKNGKAQGQDDAWLLADQVLEDMQQTAAQEDDQTFAEFLNRSAHPPDAKRLAASYVEGFNAARKEVIGIASLAQDAEAADAIDGDRSFRILNGYDSIAKLLAAGIGNSDSALRLSAIVERIRWEEGSATVRFRSALTDSVETVCARRVVVTVPLGVLQSDLGSPGAIHFDPEPADVLSAARKLCFGPVMRVVLRFREPFWEENDWGDVGFLLSDEQYFPTWWTTLPVRAPVITGWSAGPHADGLSGQPRSNIIAHALRDLRHITSVSAGRISTLLESANFYDWSSDPFTCGAYSYVPAGALAARETLAQPVADTLYFAGEATELNGHSATVHGAIASGGRVADQILGTAHGS